MKKKLSVIIALVMCFSIVFSTASVSFASAGGGEAVVQEKPANSLFEEYVIENFAELESIVPLGSLEMPSFDTMVNRLVNFLYDLVDKLIYALVKVLRIFLPGKTYTPVDEYVSKNFYNGMDVFLDSPAEGAQWSVGYASNSIQTGNELNGKHYVGGSLSLSKKVSAVHDDQRVRVMSIDDGSGRGAVVFAVIDAYGMSAPDVRKIRARLENFAQQNNIVSINIGVLHQHSGVDTFGLNGNLLTMLFKNTFIYATGIDIGVINGQNDEYMEHLFAVTTQSIKDAYNNMKPGTLMYGEVNVAEYMRDKREPMVYDENLNRFRFVPDDGSRETWFTNTSIHCVGLGAGTTEVSGDYPYYMEKVIEKEAGANFILIQGAELAITSNSSLIEGTDDMSRLERVEAYGTALAEKLLSIDPASEREIAPLLNIRHSEILIPISNEVLKFAADLNAVTNEAIIDGKNVYVATEIGYMEFGTDISAVIIPGEIAPEIIYGGCLDASESWTGKDWTYNSVQSMVGKDRKLIVFGIVNDQVGYILPDNDYSSIISGVNEEIVATGNRAGSTVIVEIEKLISSVR